MHKTLQTMCCLAVLGFGLAMAAPGYAKERNAPPAGPKPPGAASASETPAPPGPPPVARGSKHAKLMAKKFRACMKMPEKMSADCAKSKKCKDRFEKKKAECDQMKAEHEKRRAMYDKMMQENRIRFEEMRKNAENERIFKKMTRHQKGNSPFIDPAPGNTQEPVMSPLGHIAYPPPQ